jgi:hypothetical protein
MAKNEPVDNRLAMARVVIVLFIIRVFLRGGIKRWKIRVGEGAEALTSGMARIASTPKNTVGASLLAKAVCQSTSSLIDPPPSRAGSLPQGIVLFWPILQA